MKQRERSSADYFPVLDIVVKAVEGLAVATVQATAPLR
jgi:hypothetical protein